MSVCVCAGKGRYGLCDAKVTMKIPYLIYLAAAARIFHDIRAKDGASVKVSHVLIPPVQRALLSWMHLALLPTGPLALLI